MKAKTFWWTIFALATVRLVQMAVIPVFEPSEARYAAISANMARSGDFVVPRFTHNLEYQSFDGKPPLVFQAGGLCCALLGTENPYALQFGVRVFPFLSAALLLLILFRVVRCFADADAARLAVMICASCTAFFAAAGLSMTDMSLTCCVAGALLLYRCFLETNSLGSAAGVALLLGAGMIVKGPVAMVMFGLPLLVDAIVNRRWRGIFNGKWLMVAPLFLLVAVPWFVLIERRNPGSVLYFFYNENFLRFITPDYGDKYGAGREAFRGVSVLWMLVATLPWALWPVWRLVRHPKVTLKSPVRKAFPVLALLSIVGFWCLTSRVLVYYLFPVIPLFAAALAVYGPRERLARLAPRVAALSLVIITAAFVSGQMFSEKMQGVRTPFSPQENHYAHEFYHGTKSADELKALRAARDESCRQLLRRIESGEIQVPEEGRR